MLKDKWALVTGATAGLGLAVAKSLAGAGAIHTILRHPLNASALLTTGNVSWAFD